MARVTVDTNCCIYLLQNVSGEWREFASALFSRAGAGQLVIELPGVVRFELLVRPFRSGDREELRKVRRLTMAYPGVESAEITDPVIETAARIRAITNLQTPDALVVGSAIEGGCDGIVGNDKRFKSLNRLTSAQLRAAGAAATAVPQYVHMDDYVEGA